MVVGPNVFPLVAGGLLLSLSLLALGITAASVSNFKNVWRLESFRDHAKKVRYCSNLRPRPRGEAMCFQDCLCIGLCTACVGSWHGG